MARILIIDDNILVRETYGQMLQDVGYEVAEAGDGEEGIKSFLGNPAELIITDIIMPKKDGLETIFELRREFPDVKIIAISGGGKIKPEDYLEFAQALGVMRILTKPVKREELLAAVRECLS